MRKTHSKNFKFKVAIEAIKSDLTIAEIISKFEVAESLIHKWKKQLVENGDSIFDSKNTGKSMSTEPSQDIEKLHTTIGKLKVENDFLEQALSKLTKVGAKK